MEKIIHFVTEDQTEVESRLDGAVFAKVLIDLRIDPCCSDEQAQHRMERLRRAKEKFLEEYFSIVYGE